MADFEPRIIDADLGRAEHSRAILDLLDEYVAQPIIAGTALAEKTRSELISGLKRHPTTRVLLAYDDDEPIGVAICFLGFSTFAAKPLINIHDLSVREAWRGRGVGRKLIHAIAERARAIGCCRLTLEVREDNERARALYASEGFRSSAGDEAQSLFVSKVL